MKNKRNIKQQKIYKRRRIAFVVILILLAVILFLSIKSNLSLKKIAKGENALNIEGEALDLSGVLNQEPNPPQLGAGMIPVKWNEDKAMWEITTVNDSKWYDYSKGKWANVMLSDRIL